MRGFAILGRCAAGGLLLLATLGPSPGASASGGRAEPDQSGPWLVGSRPPRDHVLTHSRPKLVVRYQLPPGTRQGAGQWFTFRLRAFVTLQPGGPERGAGSLVATTSDGRAAALVTLRTQQDDVEIFYDGFLTGPVTRTTAARTVAVDYQNYVQTAGIRGGANRFEITFEDLGQLIRQVRVDPLTGLSRTTVPPDQLAISAPAVVHAKAGKRFSVPYRVTRRGDRPDRPLTVTTKKAGPLTLTVARHTYDSVGRARHGEFHGIAERPGRYQLALRAAGGYNDPFQLVQVDVRPASGPGVGPIRVVLAGGLILLALLLVAPRRRGRAGPRSR